MTTVAIMQPTYLPWQGYMDMIDQADLFILLDTVSVSRQSWQTRNRVLTPDGRVTWLPVPVNTRMRTPLNEVLIVGDYWRRKHSRTIAGLGNRVPDRLLACYEDPAVRLVDFTGRTLRALCRILGITTPLVWASSLELPETEDRIERVQAIFDAVGGTEFLSTHGGQDYQIPTRWHEYEPQPYPQNGGPFISHLSIVDALARIGPESTLDLIRSGRKVAV